MGGIWNDSNSKGRLGSGFPETFLAFDVRGSSIGTTFMSVSISNGQINLGMTADRRWLDLTNAENRSHDNAIVVVIRWSCFEGHCFRHTDTQ